MATKKKLLEAAAGSAGGAGGLDVSEVFSTYLYTGNSTGQTITNGIDLAGEGGLVWAKSRSSIRNNILSDTERGTGNVLFSNNTNSNDVDSTTITSYNSDGFTMGSSLFKMNSNGDDFASWTFRKAPKFFDVVTYTGTGSAQNISHNLGTTVGTIFVKCTTDTFPWTVFHRSLGATEVIVLNSTGASYTDSAPWNNTAPTDSVFTVGTDSGTNSSGQTYVAYLFAHNNGDGTFGPTGDQDVIRCGSYTGNGSTNGPEIDLGFEPQWLLIKNATASDEWPILDSMRGIVSGGNDSRVWANLSNAENTGDPQVQLLPKGFQPESTSGSVNASGNTYIYIAIRRGPMAVPTDATDVFTPELGDGSSDPGFNAAPSPIDFFIRHNRSGASPLAGSRLTGRNYLNTSNTAAESTSTTFDFDYMNGFYNSSSGTTEIAWMWKRAPNYFDVVAYTGNGSGTRTVAHNLGVAPDMLWLKRRDGSSPYGDWYVQSTGIAATNYLTLNGTGAQTTSPDAWSSTYAASDVFTVGPDNNVSGFDYIVYLFASLDGVSKVGSYTGTGSDLTVDCGFSSGARFVLVKPTSTTGNWTVVDTERGLIAGNDPILALNDTGSEDTAFDSFDPNSSGFIVPSNPYTNVNGVTYIFYAIA